MNKIEADPNLPDQEIEVDIQGGAIMYLSILEPDVKDKLIELLPMATRVRISVAAFDKMKLMLGRGERN